MSNFPAAISTRALQKLLHEKSNARLASQPTPSTTAISTPVLPKHPAWVSIVVRSTDRIPATQFNELKQSLTEFVQPLAVGPAHAMRSRDGLQLQMMAKVKPGDIKSVEAFVLGFTDEALGLTAFFEVTAD